MPEIELLTTTSQFAPREHISASQVNLFLECPARYFYAYQEHLRISSLGVGLPAEFGNFMHSLIEMVSRDAVLMADGKVYEAFTLDDILKRFEIMLTNYPKLCSQDFIVRGRKQLKWWYEQEEAREAQIATMVNGQPAIEAHFERYLPNGVLIKGFIDRAEHNKFTGPNRICLIDWKTGFMVGDYAAQMKIYNIASYSLFPEGTEFSTYMYQTENEFFKPYDFTIAEIEEFYEFIGILKMSMIKFADDITIGIQARQDVEDEEKQQQLQQFLDGNAKVNKFCYTCQGKHKCIAFIKTMITGVPGVELEHEKSDVNVLAQYKKQVDIVRKLAEKEVAKVDNILQAIILKNGEDFEGQKRIKLDDGENEVAITRRGSTYVDKITAVKIAVSHGMTDTLSMSVSAARGMLEKLEGEDHDMLAAAIIETKSPKETIIIRKIKKARKKKG